MTLLNECLGYLEQLRFVDLDLKVEAFAVVLDDLSN